MRKFVKLIAILTIAGVTACQTAQQAKEIQLVGFGEDVSKGTSLGPIEGSDCVFMVLGYWLGGAPTLSRAMMNARKGKKSSVSDVAGGAETLGEGARYLNNVSVSKDGFNAGIVGKSCINISATGYK